MFRQDRTNPSTAVSNWKGRKDTARGWPSTAVSTWLNGGLFGAVDEDFQAILSTLVGSDSSSVTLTSAGSSAAWTEFQDLLLISQVKSAHDGIHRGVFAKLNANASNYSNQNLYVVGTHGSMSAGTEREDLAGARIDYAAGSASGVDADYYGCAITTFGDINSGRYKTVQTMGGVDVNGSGAVGQCVTTWRDTAVVTSIEIVDSGGSNIIAGSRFDLYGLRV